MRVSSSSSASSTSRISISKRGDLEVVEADGGVPLVEAEVLVPGTGERIRIGELEVREAVHRPLQRLAVAPLDLEVVRLPRLDRTRALVVAARLDVELEAVLAVLVEL